MKKILSVLLLLSVLVSSFCFPGSAEEILYTDTLDGGKVTYTVYADGTAVFEGTGEIDNHIYSQPVIDSLYRKNVKTIIVKPGITYIKQYAFAGMENLESVTLPDDITDINDDTFFNCKKLVWVDLPKNLIHIGPYAFGGCDSLQQIVIPDKVQKIWVGAFFSSGLREIVLPDSVQELQLSAFSDCEDLVSVRLPGNLTTIERTLFEKCRSLKTVEIPDCVTEIRDSAFAGCTSLETLTIPQSVTTLGSAVFQNCKALKSVYLEKTVKKVNKDMFPGCDGTVLYFNGKESAWKTISSDLPNKEIGVFLPVGDGSYTCMKHSAGEEVIENRKEPTCTGYGGYYTVAYCKFCGTELTRDYHVLSNFGGHKWGPVQRLDGECHRYVCQRDPTHILDEAHKWDFDHAVSVRPSGEGCIFTYACSLCGEETERTKAHRWDLGKISAVPTAASDGAVTFTCIECGIKTTRAIPFVKKQTASLSPTEQIDVLLAYKTFLEQQKPQSYLYFDLDNNGIYEILGAGVSTYTVYMYKNEKFGSVGEFPYSARFYALPGADLLFYLNNAGDVCAVRYENGSVKTQKLIGGASWAETQGSRTDLTKTYASDRITFPKLTNLQKAYVKTIKEAFAAAELKEYTGYHFFDMDRDGYYEVIEAQVIAMPTDAGTVFAMQYTFWTYRNGNMTKLGSFRTGSFQAEYGRPEFQPPDNGDGVVLFTWIDTQRYRTDLIYIENGKLKQKQLSSGADSDSYFYVSENTVPAYPMHLIAFPADVDLIPETAHRWDSGVVISPATLTENGQVLYTCLTCGETKTELIPKTGLNMRLGDVDGNGEISSADARLCLRRAVDLETYEKGSAKFIVCDVDRNGEVTSADARLILRAAVDLEDPNSWL